MNHKKTFFTVGVIVLIAISAYGYYRWIESKKLALYLSDTMIVPFSPGQNIEDIKEVPDNYVPIQQEVYPDVNETAEFRSELSGFSFIAPKNDTFGEHSPTRISFREKYGDEIFFYAINNGNNLRVQAIRKNADDTLDNWLKNHFNIALETIEDSKMVEIADYQALQFDITGALDESVLYAGKGSTIDNVRDDFPPFPTFSYSLYVGNELIKEEVTFSTRYIVIDVGNRFLLASFDTWQSDEVVAEAESILGTLRVFDTFINF
ncbi:MAG: hypothetical protein RLZZ230_398 [Candidatus Parcubacteria bacterium]|jgi:hypothetical protein